MTARAVSTMNSIKGRRRPSAVCSQDAGRGVAENGGPSARQFGKHRFQPLVAQVDTAGVGFPMMMTRAGRAPSGVPGKQRAGARVHG